LHEGEVSYPRGQPAALTAQQVEAGYALLCSAIAESDLTIEPVPPDFNG
jgi:ferredoxin